MDDVNWGGFHSQEEWEAATRRTLNKKIKKLKKKQLKEAKKKKKGNK